MTAPPPSVTIKPAAPKSRGPNAVYQQFVKAHGIDPKVAGDIRYWANQYGIDPTYFAAVLTVETHTQHTNPDGSVKVSSAGARGIGQIMPLHIGEPVPWQPNRRITANDLDNYGFNVRWSAYYLAKQVNSLGYANAYAGAPGAAGGGYNHGGPGDEVNSLLPAGYIPTGSGTSPETAASRGAETKAAGQQLSATWAVLHNGKIKFVAAPTAPNGTLKVYGQPLQETDFLRLYATVSDTWQAYTGKRPNYSQAASILAKGWSDYQFKTWLAGKPDFIGSPVWKQNAPGYKDVWSQVYGPDSKPDQAAVRYAIVNNLGSSGFANGLRQRPDYLTSNEYKSNFANLENVYRTIYGNPTPTDIPTIQQATLHGWDQNTFAQYLRKQPDYTKSTEYATRALSFLGAIGMLTGQQATLTPGTPTPLGGEAPKLPTDQRAPAATGGLSGIGNLVPGLTS